jgi:hypothetical protein
MYPVLIPYSGHLTDKDMRLLAGVLFVLSVAYVISSAIALYRWLTGKVGWGGTGFWDVMFWNTEAGGMFRCVMTWLYLLLLLVWVGEYISNYFF